MLFRSRKRDRDRDAAVADLPQTVEEMFEALEALTRKNRERRDPELERRLLMLRHRAGANLSDPDAEQPPIAEPDFEALPTADGSVLPPISPDQLTPGVLRAGILHHGCLLVRGVIDAAEAAEMVREIQHAFEARQAYLDGHGTTDGYYEEFQPDPPFDLEGERDWVTGGGGVWGADSPRVLFEVLDKLERAGLQRVITEYLGERPAISVNKCTLRKVDPDSNAGWHQDGAFLGDDVRAMNVWMALTRCGDEAPGMDIVPRRLDDIVETGTEGAWFDWSVSPAKAQEAAGETGIVRPIFEPGDVLLFDDMFLHSTAAEPTMKKSRYAVESWFFGTSHFPTDYVPLAF